MHEEPHQNRRQGGKHAGRCDEAIIGHPPATLYVATFVGAPPMNLLSATTTPEGLSIAGLETPLALRHGLEAGRPVTLGIRPEALGLAARETALAFHAELAELTGPELVVTGTVGGQKLVASLPPASGVSPGDRATLFAAPEAFHLFDPATGLRLNRDR